MKEVFGESLSMKEIIDYQKDSVVSKTLIKKETGTVTFFAFTKDQALSEHTAPFDALVYVFDGKCIVTISKEEKEVSCGEVIVMPAGKPHSVRALGDFKMMLVMIKQ